MTFLFPETQAHKEQSPRRSTQGLKVDAWMFIILAMPCVVRILLSGGVFAPGCWEGSERDRCHILWRSELAFLEGVIALHA